jgi:hypothetical protein
LRRVAPAVSNFLSRFRAATGFAVAGSHHRRHESVPALCMLIEYCSRRGEASLGQLVENASGFHVHQAAPPRVAIASPNLVIFSSGPLNTPTGHSMKLRQALNLPLTRYHDMPTSLLVLHRFCHDDDAYTENLLHRMVTGVERTSIFIASSKSGMLETPAIRLTSRNLLLAPEVRTKLSCICSPRRWRAARAPSTR